MALDHYKFWKVNPETLPKVGAPVLLKGQFDRVPWEALVFGPLYVANPVEKRRMGYREKPILNEKLHYLARRIQTEKRSKPRNVLVTNQFGENQVWTLGQPEWLLVPAAKVLRGEAGKPPIGDHFVCYAAKAEKQVHVAVTLSDQFDRLLKKPEEVGDFEAAYLCVPVSKQRKGKPVEEVRDKQTHLALYTIAPTKFGKTVFANDQFGSFTLPVGASEFLGVPSTKKIA